MNYPRLLVSDKESNIIDVDLIAGARSGYCIEPANIDEFIPLPFASEMFLLPGRHPIGFTKKGEQVALKDCFAVSAFVSPGYTQIKIPAYAESSKAPVLPLFAYTSVAFFKGKIYAACRRVDWERRQDIRLMDMGKVQKTVSLFQKLYPHNRLMRHLEKCALLYGCPAGKNFFLGRYEAPLPTSPVCNCECFGCLSLQKSKKCSCTQPRIKFVPSPEEIAQVALIHIKRTPRPVVSFGQGCEGEPLMVYETIRDAIKLIRAKTRKGTINLNTNASRPAAVEELIDAGLNSIRVSTNSFQEEYYTRYYNPKSYAFRDVLESISVARRKKIFISVNYFVFPGFTDSKCETKEFRKVISRYKINLIQWRNLNIDPVRYMEKIKLPRRNESIGINALIEDTMNRFPQLMHGYFNPPKERWKRY